MGARPLVYVIKTLKGKLLRVMQGLTTLGKSQSFQNNTQLLLTEQDDDVIMAYLYIKK
jgi:hypothetical protein